MQVALFSLLAAIRLAAASFPPSAANAKNSSLKCSTFPTIGSKYGSAGGTLLDNALKKIVYPIQPLPSCGSQCKGHDLITTYNGSLASKLSGIDGHFLQVMTSDEKPGYLTGNKVVRAVYARETSSDPLLLKIREYTFHNDGGYYRRSRFFQYSCPAAFTEITTAETAANSKASFGIKLLTVFSNNSKIKQYSFDPTSVNSKVMKTPWTMTASGPKPWLGSVLESKKTRKYYTAGSKTVVSMQSTGLSEHGPLSIEYFFSTYPVLWKVGPSSLPLQEDLMESVITVDMGKIKPAVKAGATLQFRYEVYTGSAKLSWNGTLKVLTVTPVDATTNAGLPSLQEFYKFETFVDCIGGAVPRRLKIVKLEADTAKGKNWNGFVAITADVQGTEKCKQIVWDPTNGELKLKSASISTAGSTGSATPTSTAGPTNSTGTAKPTGTGATASQASSWKVLCVAQLLVLLMSVHSANMQ